MDIKMKAGRRGHKWVAIQRMIIDSLGERGRLTRISRADGGCNYAAPGTYHLVFTCSRAVSIVLNID